MSISIPDLEINEIRFSDGAGQPLVSGNFRSGWWTVEARGVNYRVYASIPANYPYLEMLEDLKAKFLRKLRAGAQTEIA